MPENTFRQIKETIQTFQLALQAHLPAFSQEINAIIENKIQDKNILENTLETLLSLTDMGVGEELFVQLLDYYKTIDTDGAAFCWEQFDKEEE